MSELGQGHGEITVSLWGKLPHLPSPQRWTEDLRRLCPPGAALDPRRIAGCPKVSQGAVTAQEPQTEKRPGACECEYSSAPNGDAEGDSGSQLMPHTASCDTLLRPAS